MKKRILSLVLCAAMLLSMAVLMGAGTTGDTAADTTESASTPRAVNFTNVAPFVQMNAQVQNGPARALLRASSAPADPPRTEQGALVTTKAATALGNGEYKIKLTSYTTGTVTEQQITKPTDIVLVLDRSGSMQERDMTATNYTAYTNTKNSNLYDHRDNLWYKLGDSYVPANVVSTEKYDYQPCSDKTTNKEYYQNRNNLYAYVHGELEEVTVSKSSWSLSGWTYTYTIPGTTIATSKGDKETPRFTEIDGNQLIRRTIDYAYEYSCEDNGTTIVLGTSSGADTNFDAITLYEKRDSKITRLEALKTAATNFANQIAQKAMEEQVDHRIAVVSYESDARDETSGFVDVRTGRESVITAINGLSADGGTLIDKGIETANTIFTANPITEGERNRVMIVFADGAPGLYGDWCSKSVETANQAIANAKIAKNTHNATVYTIGIFPGADASANLPDYTPYTKDWLGEHKPSVDNQIKNSNRFMHLVSSEYLQATDISTPGNRNPNMTNNSGYYLSAGDASALTEIFQKIGNNISTPSIHLGSKAEVRDMVSPYFNAPTNADSVTVYAEKAVYDGEKYTWTQDNTCTGMTASVKDQTVTVTGFDYDANFVSQNGRSETNPKDSGDFYGRRLVVEFNVTVKPEFLGGNFVPTNLPTSGVYDENGNVVENFEYPRVDIPVKAPTLTGESKNIYYNGTQLTVSDLCTANISAGMADYVTLSYSVDKGISNTVDGTYLVTVTATPKYPIAGVEQQSASAQTEATVTVFKPEVTYRDCTTNYGVAPTYQEANFVSAVWKNSSGESADDVTMIGEEPTLTYEYTPAADTFTEDTYVNVTVKANDNALPDGVVMFRHNECNFPGCSFDSNQGEFIVHINVFDLTIQKTAKAGTTIDPNQTFVFKVKNNDTGKTMEIVITGASQQTIKGLPMGSYTITEDTNWSWQYHPTEATQTITVSETSKTVTFENEKAPTNWLTSLAKALNVWTSDGTTVTRDQMN